MLTAEGGNHGSQGNDTCVTGGEGGKVYGYTYENYCRFIGGIQGGQGGGYCVDVNAQTGSINPAPKLEFYIKFLDDDKYIKKISNSTLNCF